MDREKNQKQGNLCENTEIKTNILQIDEAANLRYNQKQFFENEIACKWLSTVDAANFLRVSENALRIMVHRGQIQAYKLGRRLRFKLYDCQALILTKRKV